MNSAGHILTVTPATSPSTDTAGTPVSAQQGPLHGDKSLKNHEFSNVLDQQQHLDDDQHVVAHPIDSVDKKAPQALAPTTPAMAAAAGDGNVLPQGGQALPVGQDSDIIAATPADDVADEQLITGPAVGTVETSTLTSNSSLTTSSATPIKDSVDSLALDSAVKSKPTATAEHSIQHRVGLSTSEKNKTAASGSVSNLTTSNENDTLQSAAANVEESPDVVRRFGANGVLAAGVEPVQETKAVASKQASASTSNMSAMSLSELNARFDVKSQHSPGQLPSEVAALVNVTAADDNSTVTVTPHSPVTTPTLSNAYQQNAATQTVHSAVPIEVGKPGWTDAVMGKVMWMSSQQINSAEIALDPPELGPLQVRVTTTLDQTSVAFSSNHGAVRDALDQGVSRLREMMESQGIDLADVDVSGQSAFQRENGSEADESSLGRADSAQGSGVESEAQSAQDVSSNTVVTQTLGMIDHYV